MELMRAVRALMGVRRTAQIRRALRATAEASAIRLNGAQNDRLPRRSGAVISSRVETPGIETRVRGRDAKASTGIAGAFVSSSGSAPAGESERPVP